MKILAGIASFLRWRGGDGGGEDKAREQRREDSGFFHLERPFYQFDNSEESGL